MARFQLVLLITALRVACGSEAGASTAADLTKLREAIKEEQRRTMIADFVAESALRNQTEQVSEMHLAEKALKESKPRTQAAELATTEAQQQVKELQAKLAATKQQLADAEAKQKAATAAADNAKTVAAEAEAKAAAEHQKAEAVLPERTPVIVNGLNLFTEWLRSLPGQILIAAVAGMLGIAGLCYTQRFLQALSIGIMALGAGVAAAAQWATSSGDESAKWLSVLWGAEVALVTAAAAVIGYAGFQLFIGAVVGLVVAHLSATWAETWCQGQVALWYLGLFATGALATGLGGKRADAVLGAAAGGLMLASCCVFALVQILSAGQLPPNWVDCVNAIVSGSKEDETFGEEAMLVRCAGFIAWVVMAAIGISRRFTGWPALKRKASAEDSLRLPLLSEENTEVREAPVPVQQEPKDTAPPSGKSVWPKGLPGPGSLKSKLEKVVKSASSAIDPTKRERTQSSSSNGNGSHQKKGSRDPYDIY